MNETEINLIEALSTLVPRPVILEYRMYYNDDGQIICLTNHNHPQELTQYIVVTKEEYDNYYNYEVKNHKLSKIVPTDTLLSALEKSDSGFRVIKGHPALLLEDNEQFNEVEFYDARNS
jgi:hypothetical protein